MHGTRGARHEDVVDVEADAALAGGAAAAADAADLERRPGVADAARAFDVEIRRDGGELEHVSTPRSSSASPSKLITEIGVS